MARDEIRYDIESMYDEVTEKYPHVNMNDENEVNNAPGLLELIDQVNAKCKAYLEDNCNVFQVQFPHLNNQLVPDMKRAPGCECPHHLEGVECDECKNFVTFSSDGEIFSYKIYNAYCTKENHHPIPTRKK